MTGAGKPVLTLLLDDLVVCIRDNLVEGRLIPENYRVQLQLEEDLVECWDVAQQVVEKHLLEVWKKQREHTGTDHLDRMRRIMATFISESAARREGAAFIFREATQAIEERFVARALCLVEWLISEMLFLDEDLAGNLLSLNL